MDTVKAKIGPDAVLVIPAGNRRALGIEVGDTVVLRLEDGELRVFSIERAIRRVQDAIRRYRRDDEPLWSEQLIAERRAEATREDAEAASVSPPTPPDRG